MIILARWVVMMRKAARTIELGAARPRRADLEWVWKSCFRSALQTYLQGVDGATLAMMPEERIHAQPSFPELSWFSHSIRGNSFQSPSLWYATTKDYLEILMITVFPKSNSACIIEWGYCKSSFKGISCGAADFYWCLDFCLA
ncbi:hypothetical protein [Phyllobacterium myrsinacearum]|uniref:hypothetical protein n=1 Tax=Phyllobacterium myrsinacearum TaxID=28101 RepID=UPI0015FC772F|nr:hypothetical protein [Phyllobacterium myrsinacearum]